MTHLTAEPHPADNVEMLDFQKEESPDEDAVEGGEE